jgi:hypothetical protein
MNPAIHLIPVLISTFIWYGIHLINRRKGWFRIGEVIFWDVIVLIIVFLVWLQWF